MKNMLKRMFLFWLFISLTSLVLNAKGVDNSLYFRSLNSKIGMTDNYVRCIKRDSQGFLWIGTVNGLNRYDGYELRKYSLANGGPENDVTNVDQDADGNLWIKVTNYKNSYATYNRSEDRIEFSVNDRLASYHILNDDLLKVDKDLNLWSVAADTLYYYRFDSASLQKFVVPQSCRVLDVACRWGVAFVLFDNGDISRVDMDNTTFVFEATVAPLSGVEHCLYIDTVDRLWYFQTHTKGLYSYDINKHEWMHNASETELKNDLITTLMDDGSGNLWIGTDNRGIFVDNLNAKGLVHLAQDKNGGLSFDNNHINCIYKDGNHTMWIGLAKLGVLYTDIEGLRFRNESIVGNPDVSSFSIVGNRLWFSFDGQGIGVKDGQTMTFFDVSKGAIPSNLVVCSYLDSQNRLWFGSYGGGAFYTDGGSSDLSRLTFRDLNSLYPQAEDMPIEHVCRIVEDVNHTLWFATTDQGLYSISADGHCNGIRMENAVLRTNAMLDMAYNNERTLYVATSVGLYAVDIFSGVATEVSLSPNSSGDEHSQFINSVYCDSRNFLWVGTRKGLHIIDQKSDRKWQLTTADGLSHNMIRAMVADWDQNMWVTTDHGVTYIKYYPNETMEIPFICCPYTESDGIENTFNNHAIAITEQGNILMGSVGGYLEVNAQNPAAILTDSRAPIFTNVYVDDRKVQIGDLSQNGNPIINDCALNDSYLHLDEGDGALLFDVSAMDFINQHKLEFVYRVNGGSWEPVSGHQIKLGHLSCGKYQIEVKVRESNPLSKNPISSMQIEVSGPIWHSWWFWIIGAFVLSLLAAFVYRIKSRMDRRNLINRMRKVIHEMNMLVNADAPAAKTNIEIEPSQIEVTSLDQQLIDKAIKIVEANIDDVDFSVEELGAQLGVSRSGLYKKMMAITGKSPIEFIRIIRVKRGLQLLQQSGDSILQVAYQVGLSPKQFSKYFKDEYGCLPSAYRSLGNKEGADAPKEGEDVPNE